MAIPVKSKSRVTISPELKSTHKEEDLELSEWVAILSKAVAEHLKPMLLQQAENIKEIQKIAIAEQIKITIDESIADVGIGQTTPLQKGEESAKLFKEQQSSDDIQGAKNKLKALKKG